MTVSSSIGRQWTIDQLVTRAWRYAGLLEISTPATTQQLTFGRELMDDILDALATEGAFARVVSFYEQLLVAGTYKYTMPANVIDIVTPAMYIDPTNTDTSKADGETIINVIRQEEWQRYSSKSAKGRPYKVYPHRVSTPIEVFLWPIPDEAGTVRFQIHRRLADSDDGSSTFDLENYWMEYLKTELAHQLAESQSMESGKVNRLFRDALMKLNKAKGKANQRTGTRMFIAQTARWQRND